MGTMSGGGDESAGLGDPRTGRGITCGSLREVKRLSGRRAREEEERSKEGDRGGEPDQGEGATGPEEGEEGARKKERQDSGRAARRSAVRSSQWLSAAPPHTTHSPKTHSHGLPLGASQHPSLQCYPHLPKKQPQARAQWRRGGGRLGCVPQEDRLVHPGGKGYAKSSPGHEFLALGPPLSPRLAWLDPNRGCPRGPQPP